MRVTLFTATAALALMVATDCQANPAPPAGTPTASLSSGLQGHTLVDGGCPVIRAGTPCPDKPLPARLTITRPGSAAVVAATTSDTDGQFRIPLPPGHYIVHPANLTGAILPSATPTDVYIHAGEYTTITVTFDSGIR